MPKEFQSILLEDLKIRWPGFAIRRVALNQHMPRVERLGEHLHKYAQILLYLRGGGLQHLGDRSVPVSRGSVLVVPPGQTHRFEKTRPVRPICLVLDFETDRPPPWREVAVLGARDLALVERWLFALHEQHLRPDGLSIQTAMLILRLLGRIEKALGSGGTGEPAGPITAAVRSLVKREGLSELTPARVAEHLGRTLDHLNRQIQTEAGTTVGGLLNRLRLDEVTRALRASDITIGEIAVSIGMDDQNYFARWFRKQTGQTPSRWRAAMRQ